MDYIWKCPGAFDEVMPSYVLVGKALLPASTQVLLQEVLKWNQLHH